MVVSLISRLQSNKEEEEEPTLAGLEYKYNIAMKEKSMARLQVPHLRILVD